MNKVLFTHIDMDGSGSAILIKKLYPDIDIHYVDYGFDSDMSNLELMAKSDLLIFTDISISESTAKLLENTRINSNKILLLLDHHQSAYDKLSGLNYEWINIIPEGLSGTMMVFAYFTEGIPKSLRLTSTNSTNNNYNNNNDNKDNYNNNNNYNKDNYNNYKELLIKNTNKNNYKKILKTLTLSSDFYDYYQLAVLIDDYDLWIHKYDKTRLLQFLWSSIGRDKFLDRFIDNPNVEFTSDEVSIANIEESKFEESYLLAKSFVKDDSIITDKDNLNFLVLNCIESYTSLVSDKILKENLNIHYLAIVNKYKSTVSLRSLHTNVEEIAKSLGGGGHKLASGFSYSNNQDIVQSIINRKVEMIKFNIC
jgi:hypothetical protein